MNIRILVGMVAVALSIGHLGGCGKSDDGGSKAVVAVDSDRVKFDYQFDISRPSFMDVKPESLEGNHRANLQNAKVLWSDKERLHRRIVRNEPVSFNTITSLWIRDQAQHYSEQKNDVIHPREVDLYVSRILRSLRGANPNDLKINYEEQMALLSPAHEIFYDSAAASVFDIIHHQSLQAYSGTVFNQILTRRYRGAIAFQNAHLVVILEPGHLLPGYFKKEGERWVLIGVETTTSGPSQVYYGPSDSLPSNILVVDAELFALLDLYKSHLTNPDDAITKALRITAERYAITSAKAVAVGVDRNSRAFQSIAANHPLAFGSRELPAPGQRDRIALNTVHCEEPRPINGVDVPRPASGDSDVIPVPDPSSTEEPDTPLTTDRDNPTSQPASQPTDPNAPKTPSDSENGPERAESPAAIQ